MAIDGQTMAEPGLAVPRVGPGQDVSSPSRLVRGACPSLAAPMQTGDGLLVRLRPSTAGLTLPQFRQLATAVARHGNGLIEVTARGSLQLRGLSPKTMPGLEADIAAAEIVPDTGLTIETPPLSGKDPAEIADARRMAARLRQTLARLPRQLRLAPKLTIIVDGGAPLSLDAVSADIRLTAMPAAGAEPQWRVAVGGIGRDAVPLSSGSGEQALATVVELLHALDALGARARGRDLVPNSGSQQPFAAGAPDASQPGASYVGIHRLAPNAVVLGLRLAFGQIPAGTLIAFLDIAAAEGVDEIRTAPDHALLLLGASPAAAAKLQAAASRLGFWTEPGTPASTIASCSGAGGCASATYPTKSLAADVVDWVPALLDGSIVLHLSGCPKGCAHPAESVIAVVGVPAGFGIVVQGRASGMPAVVVDANGLKQALRQLAQRVASTKVAGESVKDCLTRLGGDAIIAALRQE